MTIIRASIRYPVTTAVGVILLTLFGMIALFRLPVQLTPNVEDPVITITTVWPGASPVEVEREIIQEQEEQLSPWKVLSRWRASPATARGPSR